MSSEYVDGPRLSSGLAFPGAVRLELDELLDQVIARAGELKSVQGRLRSLLAATQYVAERLELDALVQRLVDSARALVGARSAALGVVRDGRVVTFVHSGEPTSEGAAVGDLLQGDGILATLLADPRPLRLRDLTEDPTSIGLTPDHGLLRSFLGAPLRVGGTVYGLLYLTDKEGTDEFGRDDEELVTALAGAAGVAVENALLLDGARRRARWQTASAELGRELLSGSLDPADGLRHLLEEALGLADAQGAAVTSVTTAGPDRVDVPCAAGDLAALERRSLDDGGTVTRAALDADGPIVLTVTDTDPRSTLLRAVAPQVGSALATRLADGVTGDGTRAVLVLTRDHGRLPFDGTDAEMVEGLAAQASATLALARSRADREALRRVEDREALVADLNAQVLQRLLRVGSGLAGAAAAADGPVRARVLDQIDELDDLVRELRRTVWADADRGATTPRRP
ncbi:GAF domain-containing protein [Actinomycetospora soli]|uniref:GAF domain-containing protein n=1 Tax=Actinomycetospora soli TaxID=2893887 RepID=UPI001E3C8D47|nr:GAF domain-containing protein [Actinomycetospora soli]MCD2187398.1 GAF domain-containing protein [Actinomycetospora soli]